MDNDLTKAIARNGMFAKRPIYELLEGLAVIGDVHIAIPTTFVDGVAVISRLKKLSANNYKFRPYLLIFLECEPDTYYYFQPSVDTMFQLDEWSETH